MSDAVKADGPEWLMAKLGSKRERVPQPTRDDVAIAEKFKVRRDKGQKRK